MTALILTFVIACTLGWYARKAWEVVREDLETMFEAKYD